MTEEVKQKWNGLSPSMRTFLKALTVVATLLTAIIGLVGSHWELRQKIRSKESQLTKQIKDKEIKTNFILERILEDHCHGQVFSNC